MKKIILVLIFIAFGFPALAQDVQNSDRKQKNKPTVAELKENWAPQFIIGANLTFEKRINLSSRRLKGELNYNPYLSLEGRFTYRSGMVFNIGYRTDNFKAGTAKDIEYPEQSLEYLSFALSYKYYSRGLNLSFGIRYDNFMSRNGDLPQYRDSKNRLGSFIGFSKDITLYKGLILEPYVQFDFMFYIHRDDVTGTEVGNAIVNTFQSMFRPQGFVAAGIGLKYRF